MIYKIRGENVEITSAMKDYVEEKVDKIEKYFQEPIDAIAHINISVHQNQEKIEVTIPMKGIPLRAEAREKDFYAAVDAVADKLERQIRKYKTKVNRKLREKEKHVIFLDTKEQEETEEEIQIVRTKRFDLKPMDVEEAILQMNLVGHDFFVFLDAKSEGTSMVYKRKDGKYGLIEMN